MTATKWTHKVYREARDGKGQWFRLPGRAVTFATESEARDYAAGRVKELAGQVYGHRLTLAARVGGLIETFTI